MCIYTVKSHFCFFILNALFHINKNINKNIWKGTHVNFSYLWVVCTLGKSRGKCFILYFIPLYTGLQFLNMITNNFYFWNI